MLLIIKRSTLETLKSDKSELSDRITELESLVKSLTESNESYKLINSKLLSELSKLATSEVKVSAGVVMSDIPMT